MYLKSPVMQFPSVRLSLIFLRAEYKICTYYIYIIGERAKRARHSQVCSIENRGYIYIYYIYIVRANFVLITRKEGGA